MEGRKRKIVTEISHSRMSRIGEKSRWITATYSDPCPLGNISANSPEDFLNMAALRECVHVGSEVRVQGEVEDGGRTGVKEKEEDKKGKLLELYDAA